MSNPKVTIAMVTYNSEKYVSMAIKSILSSSYKDFELLISDDCSTDNTWALINEFNDQRINSYRSNENIGEYANRNLCLEKAKGEYFIFIDGDDVMYPHGLEFMIKMISAFPDCAMAIMYPFDARILLPAVIDPKTYYLNYFFGNGLMAVAFTNTLFKTLPLLDEKLSKKYMAGDDLVRLKIASKYNTLIIPDQLTWWRETQGQASKRLKNNKLLSITQGIQMGLEILSLPNLPFDNTEKEAARKSLMFQLKMQIMQTLKNLNIVLVIKMLKLCSLLSCSFFDLIFAKKPDLDPFKNFTPDFPFQKDFFKSPFVSI